MSNEPVSSGSVSPERQMEDLKGFAKSLRRDFEQERAQLWDEIDGLREENRRLYQELEEVKQRTDLLRLLEEDSKPSGEQAQAALVQHLYRKAKQREEKLGRRPTASLDREQAAEALHHPDVHRTTYNKWMQRAADRVDSAALQYDDGRLKINLQAGDLPERFVTEGSL